MQVFRTGQLARIHGALPAGLGTERGLFGLHGTRCVWSGGASEVLQRKAYHAQHGHVWKGILLRRRGSVCHAGVAERWTPQTPVQPGVVHQPCFGFYPTAYHRLGKRLL